MKNALKILSLSILISFLAFNSFSQKTEDQKPTVETQEEQTDTRTDQEKFDEAEVRKFIEIVTTDLNDKKDVRKLSEKLVISDFIGRTNKRNRFLREFLDDIADELPIDEQIDGNIELLNTVYLVMASMIGNGIFQDEEKFNEMTTMEIVNKVIPKSVFAIIERNRFLNEVLKKELKKEKDSTDVSDQDASDQDSEESSTEDEKDPKIENINELRELISAIKDINAEMRTYIESQSEVWEKTNNKPSKIEEERANYFSAEPCEVEDCDGLQKGQMIYHADSFPFCVRIINEFGSYKVLDFRIEFGD